MDLRSIENNRSILILSILDRIKFLNKRCILVFNFKGFYRGKKISAIEVSVDTSEMLAKGESYIALIEHVEVCDGILKGRLLKYEKVFQ
jgi:hypothetical protein